MSRSVIILLVVLGLLGIVAMNGCGSYNRMVGGRETVNQKWSDLQTQYQRRSDLIPNLVSTVKGQANFEKSTLEAVINARANATKVTVNADQLDEQTVNQIQQQQGALSSALGRLLVVSEQYPQLQTNGAFTELRAELAGAENRIAISRQDYNKAARDFNTSIQSFPRNVWAGMFGFKTFGYFQADPGSDKAPKISPDAFDTNK